MNLDNILEANWVENPLIVVVSYGKYKTLPRLILLALSSFPGNADRRSKTCQFELNFSFGVRFVCAKHSFHVSLNAINDL